MALEGRTTSSPAPPPAPARTAGVSGVWCSAWLCDSYFLIYDFDFVVVQVV